MSEKTKILTLACSDDYAEIAGIYKACSEVMNLQGLFNWDESYPDEGTIRSDINNSRLWKAGKPLYGIVTVTREQPEEYLKINWREPDHFAVIRRLAVHPEYQGKGIAKKIMVEIEATLQEKAVQSIRLDVYAESMSVIKLYHRLGYKEIGTFHYEGYQNHFIAMEKAI